MPTAFLDEAEQSRLNRFPAEIVAPDLYSYFTLTEADKNLALTQRGEENWLGFALQLCALRYLGFCPNELQTAPPNVVHYLADQLGVKPDVLTLYGQRDKTRTQHAREVIEYCGFRSPTDTDFSNLTDWLVQRALEHDKPTTLLGLVAEKLRKACIVRPGITRLVKLVATAREQAHSETYRLLLPLFTQPVVAFLDDLLKPVADLKVSRLEWLRQNATENSPKAILTNLTKLTFLREAKVNEWQLNELNPKPPQSFNSYWTQGQTLWFDSTKSGATLPHSFSFCSALAGRYY